MNCPEEALQLAPGQLVRLTSMMQLLASSPHLIDAAESLLQTLFEPVQPAGAGAQETHAPPVQYLPAPQFSKISPEPSLRHVAFCEELLQRGGEFATH